MTPRAEKILASVRRHREATGGDLFADVLAGERTGPRVVSANEHWTAFVPAATRWPYEVQFFPTRRVPDLPALDDAERDAFVEVYLDVLGRFARRFDTPMPYIASWNQAPVNTGREDWWLHLQLFSFRRAPGKLKYLAGSESGMGAFITDTNPEDVAEQLRVPSVVAGSASDDGRAGREPARAAGVRRAVRRRPEGVWAAPGRVNVIGEHTDYNDGFVLPDRAAAHHPRGGRAAHRRAGRPGLAAGRRRGGRARRRRAGARPARRLGRLPGRRRGRAAGPAGRRA